MWMMREFHEYVRVGKLAYVAGNFRPSSYLYGLVIILALIGAGGAVAARGGALKRVVVTVSSCSFSIFLIHPLIMEVTAARLRIMPIAPLLQSPFDCAGDWRCLPDRPPDRKGAGRQLG